MTEIKILGTGCTNCRILAENAERAAQELSIPYELIKVGDMADILSFDIAATPAIVVNGEVKNAGSVLSVNEIKALLT